MANIHGIEVSGETYDLEDSNARQGVQTNANDIDDIQAVVPSSASSSNKLTTQNDIPDISPGNVVTESSSGFTASFVKAGNVVQVTLQGRYTGPTTESIPVLFIIPTGFIPKLNARSALVNNDSDVPMGQMVAYSKGNLGIWGGSSQIVSDGAYSAGFSYIVD